MLRVEFEDAYGEKMTPIEVSDTDEANVVCERLERLGYLEISVMD